MVRKPTAQLARKRCECIIILGGDIKPEEDRFKMLNMKGKYFIDAINLIAYRAETAMVNIVRQTMCRHNDARILLRSLYPTEADILTDHEK